jgi:thiosulfate/3-mercaptopyruvate sulfurtransferase
LTVDFGPLVSAGWLAAHVDDADLRIVDCRWYLGEPDRGPAAYHSSHIHGSVYFDLDRDLSSPHGPGRHPLPDPTVFMETLGRTGINPATRVVAYDDRGGAVASRLWWLLRDLGHDAVAVLDGGLAQWSSELMDTASVLPRPTTYEATPGHMPQMDRDGITVALGNVKLLDARAGERYRGETEPVDPVAGHIPTALSAPQTDNLEADERFKSPEVLATQFARLGAAGDELVVTYCGSGVTACSNILAMEVAGLATPTLYPGSWSDWSTAGGPVAVGPDPGGWPVW